MDRHDKEKGMMCQTRLAGVSTVLTPRLTKFFISTVNRNLYGLSCMIGGRINGGRSLTFLIKDKNVFVTGNVQ